MKRKEAEEKIHPEGECKKEGIGATGAWPVDTPGGRFYAEWDREVPVTREGQLIFFFQFLKTGVRWEEFLRQCPLSYTGNRGSGAARVLGTVLLSVLNGHWRYAHINGVRGDGVNPVLLGVGATVSEDVVRGAMRRIKEDAGLDWLSEQLVGSISPVLGLPWVLDIDTSVKPLYGHQQGSEVGYNPKKPGRPCHVYHSYFVASLRISLGVEVRPGKEHAAARGLPQLWETLQRLPRDRWPTFARGDCGYGSEAVMLEFEQRGLPYLFKLRHTLKVKELVRAMMGQGALWKDCGDGWQALESSIKLSGWSHARRVILVRENPAGAPVALEGKTMRPGKDRQSHLPGAGEPDWKGQAAPWCGKISVLVTSLDPDAYPTTIMPQQYRNRGDAENGFDELKNQWGWCGFNSRLLAPSRLMANLVALFYNWWNLYTRLYDGDHHREAVRSRPLLMQGVGRQTQSGGQRTVRVSILHEKSELIARAVSSISNELHQMHAISERWSPLQRWTLLLNRIFQRWLGGKWLPDLPPEASLFLSG